MKRMQNLQTEEGVHEKDKNKEMLHQVESSEDMKMPEQDGNKEGEAKCKGESKKSPESEKGKTHPFVEAHTGGGTKPEHQTRRAEYDYRHSTVFTIKEADMKDDDRVRGASYLGKKYETCASTVQGEGCLLFKWECEDRPVQQTDTTAAGSYCSCDMEPLTISVRQDRADKSPKRFQVCGQAQGTKCKFFLWVDEPKRDEHHRNNGRRDIPEKKTFFNNSCEKHFMFKQQVDNATERKEWWKQNYNPSTANNVMDNILRRRLITTSSMVFTRIPRLLSKLTPDSQLILMR